MVAERRVTCIDESAGENYRLFHGDCVPLCQQMPENSIDLAVYSPPFSSLFIYSESIADMGNSADDKEFLENYYYLAKELYRCVKPGRLVVVHCKELVYYQNQRGTAGLRDLPGDLIRVHEAAGWDFHSRRTIWRCPVSEMTKTKAQGLLYKQLRANSTYSRAGLPEYLLWFRKWPRDGQDVNPVTHGRDGFPLDKWQRWASPVWLDTRPTDVLNVQAARASRDERHICPLPLDLIERSILMGTNPGEIVLDPFAGIGSTGVVAIKSRRKFIGFELKDSYFKQASRYIDETARERAYPDLFERMAEPQPDVLFGQVVE